VARGARASAIGIDGRGSREPIADNSTATGRAANRRVEIFMAEPAQ
jgi:flagellar motor protein MotB